MSAVVLGPDDPPKKVSVGNYTMEVTRAGARRGVAPSPNFAAAMFIAVGPDEYYAAGTNVSVRFSPNTPGPEFAGIGTVEEGAFVNGRWVASRQLAGDETGQGQNLSLRNRPSDRNRDSYAGIQHFTLYRYH
jgi:hypothetical protein